MNGFKKMIEIFKNVFPKEVKYKTIYIIAIAYSILEIAVLFLFSVYGIDKAFKENDVTICIITIAGIFLLQIISNVLFSIAFHKGNEISATINIKTREKLFKKAMDLDKNYHNHHATGATINTIVNDVEIIGEGFFWPSFWCVIYLTRVIVCIIICCIINFELSLIILLLGPFIILNCKLSFSSLQKIDEKRRETRKRRLSHINDGIMGIKTIKALNIEKRNTEEFKGLNRLQLKNDMAKVFIMQRIWRTIDVINVTAIALLFYFSYNQYINLNISYGALYLFFVLFERALYGIGFAADNVDSLSDVLVSAEKINTLLNTKPLIEDKEEIDLSPDPLKGSIEFRNVSFKYPDGEQILKNFNLKIEPKTKVAIVGRTGDGKSTIASLIYRFFEPTEGKILLDSKDYKELPQKFIRSNIGFVLQDSMLFDDSLINNIRYGKRDASDEEVIEVCKKIGLDTFVKRMPNAYETRVGEGGILLSSGQKQLVAFARVLLRNPDIVILDEATSSIDSKTEQLIQECINIQFKDKTCIFIAHRLSTIKNSDTIIFLEKGKILEMGNHNELMKAQGKYYKLYTNQFYNKLLDVQLAKIDA